MQLELELYRTRNGKEPFRTWYENLAHDHRAFDAITRRLSRLRTGNYGNYKSVGRKGAGPPVHELRINVGPVTVSIARGFRQPPYFCAVVVRNVGNRMTLK
jgi:putative component of toxin-antitoxin plasmid stabilization module